MCWPGGKDGAGVAQRLINEIPPHDVFVSACLGDCAVLRRIRPAPRSVGIDLDVEVLRRWKMRPDQVELYRCDCVEWLRHHLGWYRATAYGDSAGEVATIRGRSGNSLQAAATDPATPAAAWFIFADPPYLMSTRSCPKQIYAHEPSAEWHGELLATLKYAAVAGARVMVTHYPATLYSEALQDWRTWTYRTQTRGGTMATEQVWCSYPVPDRLHDARFLGRDKREREKIGRRVRNALAKVQRLPPLERQAILDALITGR